MRGGLKIAVAQIQGFKQIGNQLFFNARFYEPRFIHETSKMVSLGQTARHCVANAHVWVLERWSCCSYAELFVSQKLSHCYLFHKCCLTVHS